MTEQARETPEPLTPALPEQWLIPEADPSSLLALADEWCERTEPTDIARLNVRSFAVWAALRAASPDPAEPTGPVSVRDLYFYEAGIAEGRAATPDPAWRCNHAWETDSDICPECGADWGPYLRGDRATPDPAEPGLRERLIEAVDMALRYSPDPKHSQPYLEGAIQRAYADAALARSEDPS